MAEGVQHKETSQLLEATFTSTGSLGFRTEDDAYAASWFDKPGLWCDLISGAKDGAGHYHRVMLFVL